MIPNWTFAERVNISSNILPITNIANAKSIGIVVGSNLKNTIIAINMGIVTESPPRAGVSTLCIAFAGLSNSLPFFPLPGLYVISNLFAIYPKTGVIKSDSEIPNMKIGRKLRYLS